MRETGSIGRAPDSKPGITGFESLVSRHTISHRKLIGEASACNAGHGQFDSDPVLQDTEGSGGMVCHQSRKLTLRKDGGSIPRLSAKAM
jgi:hypothetical protein